MGRTGRSGFAVPCLAALLSSCVHDDFPDRVKKGCSSVEECKRLLGEAVGRVNDCARYLTGNRARYDFRVIETRCHYEFADSQVALTKARKWASWANSPVTFVVWVVPHGNVPMEFSMVVAPYVVLPETVR